MVPRSISAADGSLLLAYDKASVLHHFEKVATTQCEQADRNRTIETDPSDNQAMKTPLQLANTVVEQTHMATMDESLAHRVIIIGRMAVVNSISKTEKIKTCQDLANVFIQMICNMSNQYDEVRLVFDRYISTSLKEQMRTRGRRGSLHITM